MDGQNAKSPGRRSGAGVCSGERTRGTLSAGGGAVKALHLRFETLPPSHTRQSQTRLCVVNGRPRSYKSRAQREQEACLLSLIMEAMPDGFVPFAGPVAVRIRFVWPYRAAERKAVVRRGLEIPHVTRPDLDNVAVKPLLDMLEQAQVFARGDAQVAELHASKAWGPRGYWAVDVSELEGAPRPFDREASDPDHQTGHNRPCTQSLLPGTEVTR